MSHKTVLSRSLFTLALLLVCRLGFGADWTVDQLMDALSQTKSAKANFIEKKYIASLDRPVESSGELLYTAPDKLEKRTLKPKAEMMVLDGDTLVLERGRQKYTTQLQDSPELASMIDSIRATLAGDRQALERNYALGLRGTREQWSMLLVPLHPKAAQMIKHIRVSGIKGEVTEIEVQQADGDRSVTTVQKAVQAP